jgi:CRP-like cAMP-binding protein
MQPTRRSEYLKRMAMPLIIKKSCIVPPNMIRMYDNNHMNPYIHPELVELLPSELLAACLESKISKGARLFTEGKTPKWMFYVTHGEIALIRNGVDGEIAFLQRQRLGFVAEASLLSDRYHCNADALLNSSLIKVPIPALKDWLGKDVQFSLRWISMLSAEVRRIRMQNERLALPTIRARILHLLNTGKQGAIFQFQGSLKLMAQELAVSHEALYRGLAALEKEGKIIRQDKLIRILD